MNLIRTQLKKPRSFHGLISWRALPFLVVIASLLLALIPLGAVTTPVLAAHHGEETAKFLPSDTDLYLAVNLDPSIDQLTKFWAFLNNWWQDPNVRAKWGEWTSNISGSGINIADDVLPWLGPEIGVGIENLTAQEPETIFFIGTMDKDASDAFFEKYKTWQVEEKHYEYHSSNWYYERGVTFNTTTYRGVETLTEEYYDYYEEYYEGSSYHYRYVYERDYYAFTNDYILVSNKEEAIQRTIDFILDGGASLADTTNFKAAQAALPAARVGMFYYNCEHIWQQTMAQIPPEAQSPITEAFVGALGNCAPPYFAASLYFTSSGIGTTAYYPLPDGMTLSSSQPDLLQSANVVPGDALFFNSGAGVNAYWQVLKSCLNKTWTETFSATTAELSGITFEQAITYLNEELDLDSAWTEIAPHLSELSGMTFEEAITYIAELVGTSFIGSDTVEAANTELHQAQMAIAICLYEAGAGQLTNYTVSAATLWNGTQGAITAVSGGNVTYDAAYFLYKAPFKASYNVTQDGMIVAGNLTVNVASPWTGIQWDTMNNEWMKSEEVSFDLDALWAEITPHLNELSGMSFAEVIIACLESRGLDTNALWAEITPHLDELSGMTFAEAVTYVGELVGTRFVGTGTVEAANTELHQAQTAVAACLSCAGAVQLTNYTVSAATLWNGTQGVITAVSGGNVTYDAAYFLYKAPFKASYNVTQDGMIVAGNLTVNVASPWTGVQWNSISLRWEKGEEVSLDLDALWAEIAPHLDELSGMTFEQAITYLDTELGLDLDALLSEEINLDSVWSEIAPHLSELSGMTLEQAITYLDTEVGLDLSARWAEITPHLEALSNMTLEQAITHLDTELGLGLGARWAEITPHLEALSNKTFDEAITYLDTELGLDLDARWTEITPHLSELSNMTFDEAIAYLNTEFGLDAKWNQMILNAENLAQQSFDRTIAHLDELLSGVNGEFAVALLPVSFEQATPDVLLMLEVENATAVKQDLDTLFNDMAPWLGLEINSTVVDGVSKTTVTSKAMAESIASLGYLSLNVNSANYLVIGTTTDALEAAVKAYKDEIPSLSDAEAYKGMLSMLPTTKMSLVYFDVSGILNTILSQQAQSELNAVQDAVTNMMKYNSLTTINGVQTPTNDMSAFPDNTTAHGTGVGWTIYRCDVDGDGVYDPGYPHYEDTSFFWPPTTTWNYTCDDQGNVTQHSNAEIEMKTSVFPLQCALGYSQSLQNTDAIIMTGAIYLLPPPLMKQSIAEGTTGTVGIPEKVFDLSAVNSEVGQCAVSANVEINNATAGSNIAMTVLKEVPDEVNSGFELAATGAGLSIVDIAYGVRVDKTNLAADNIGTANITMKVGKSWADNYGIDKIRIFRVSDGTNEVLPTTFKGYEGNYAVFEGVSVNGLSTFGLAAVQFAALQAVIISPASGTNYSTGQDFTVTANITNTGDVTANSVNATITTSGNTSLKTGETATKVVGSGTLASGASATVSWDLHCDNTDDSIITVDPAGIDANTGVAITEDNTEEDSITVHQALKAHLIAVIVSPANGTIYSTGQDFTVTANITNTGGVTANGVNATITISGNASLTIDETATKVVGSGTLASAASATVSWNLHCDNEGNSVITVDPAGIDVNTGVAIIEANTEEASITVYQALKAHLIAVITSPTSGTSYNTGDDFTVTANITNIGGVTASSVNAIITISGSASLKTGETATKVVGSGTLASGASVTVSWDLHCDNAGDSVITVTPAGIDANTGVAISGSDLVSGSVTITQQAKGEAGGCACSYIGGQVSTSGLLVGWAIVGLCWGTGYYLVRKVSRRKRR